MVRTFKAYRRDAERLALTHNADTANPVDEVQFVGAVFGNDLFSDKCVIKWMTSVGSVSVFDSFEDMLRIHGHPEYGTVIEWDTLWEDHEHRKAAKIARSYGASLGEAFASCESEIRFRAQLAKLRNAGLLNGSNLAEFLFSETV